MDSTADDRILKIKETSKTHWNMHSRTNRNNGQVSVITVSTNALNSDMKLPI